MPVPVKCCVKPTRKSVSFSTSKSPVKGQRRVISALSPAKKVCINYFPIVSAELYNELIASKR